MEETKERLKNLIDFFTGQYLQSLSNHVVESPTTTSANPFEPDSIIKTYIDDVANNENNEPQTPPSRSSPLPTSQTIKGRSDPITLISPPISKQDLESILRTLELCKTNLTHFSNNERSYLMPLMTLCGHVLLTKTHLISRSYLSTVSDVLVYILQFLIAEISNYNEDDSDYANSNPAFVKQMNNIQLFSYNSEEYYRYFVKYRLIKFLSFMLLDDDKSFIECSLQQQDLIALCQMLRMKPLPDTLRLHLANFETDSSLQSAAAAKTNTSSSSGSAASANPTTISSQYSVKRIRLTKPGQLERNSKERFFDQLLTPFIYSPTTSTLNPLSSAPVSAAASANSALLTQISSPPLPSLSSFLADSVQPDPNAPLRKMQNSPILSPFFAAADIGSPSMTMSPNSANIVTPATINAATQSTQQIRSHLISQNQLCFQYIGGATSILNLINNFTLLRPYSLHLLAIEEGVPLRLIRMDGQDFVLICDRLAADIDLVQSVFALNRLLEPLTCDRISKMIVIVQSCLIACLSLISHVNQLSRTLDTTTTIATLTPTETLIMDMIENSLALYNKVFDMFRQSNRVGGQINQNAHMFTTWLLFTGLQMILNAEPTTAQQPPGQSSTAASSNMVKRPQGYSALCIPLAKHALQLMSHLLDDLHLEFGDRNIILDEADVEDVVKDGANIKELNFINRFSFNFPASQKSSLSGGAAMSMASTTATSSSNAQQPMTGGSSSNTTNMRSSGNNQPTFKYNKFGHYSAWQRIDMIVSSNLNVIQLLFSYLSAGYRRATLLRHSICKTSSFVVEDEKMDSSTVQGSSDKSGKEKEKDDFSKMIERFVERNIDLKLSSNNSDTDNDEDDDNDFEDVNMHRSLKYETSGKHHHHFTQRKKDSSKQKQRSQKSKTPPAKPRDGDGLEKKKEALNRKESKAKLEKEIDSHYELVISILDHLNFSYVCSKIDALRSYFKQMLTDAQLIVLSHIIQDLDSEMDNVQVLTPLSSKTFNRFSNSLTSFMHNLIAMQLLTEEQQNSLLAYLGFKPSLESECSWPLHHGVRSLAILAQIILLRQHKEQEDIKLDLNSTTIQIWRGFINKLKQAALSFNGEMATFNAECPDYQEDLNVEHAQLMLFLFHNLKLLQRKHVFSLLFTAINEISQKFYQKKSLLSAAQILFIGRILHMFEYMCKNLYDTPSYLFDQVNHNLLNLNQNQDPSCPPQSREEFIKTELDDLEKYPDSYRNIKYFADIKLEENYFNYYMSRYKMSTRKQKNLKTPINMTESTVNLLSTNFFDFIIHPRFYHLMDVNTPLPKSSTLRNFKPKLDGIACNFMLAGLSSLSYDQFYDSLLNLFQFIGYQYDSKLDTKTQEEHCDKNLSNETIGYPHFGIFGLCSIDYTFGTMWRLLNQLPPSLQFLKDIVHTVDKFIANDKSFLTIDASRILNMCIWMPRFESNRPVCTWVSDLISKTANSANDMNELYQSLNNKNNANVVVSNKVTITPADIESLINDLSKRLGSLEFNYHLLKLLSWPFFRYSPPPPMSNISYNNLPSNIKHRLITQQQQLLPLQYYTFPKFFTLFTMDIYLERFVSLFQNQFKPTKISKKTYEISKLFDSQDLIERILNLLLGVFEKIYNDLAAVLIYDSPLSQAGRDDESDMKYLLHRSMVNICTTNSFEINTSDLALNLMDYLPQAIVARMDTWNRIHVNVERNISDVETPGLFQKGILFDVPLIELPANCFGSTTVTSGNTNTVSSSSNDKQISMNIFNFSGFIIEKYAILDIPEVVSVDSGYANISWIKMKQFMVKLFKFIEMVYSRKSAPLPDDQLIACWLFDLNFISKALAIKIGENQNSHLYKILNQMFDLKNDFYYNETFCSILYPYFIGNGYFIMTVYNHPLFSRLKDYDGQRVQKIFEFASIEFCKLFSKIITRTSGMLAFEEFLCEDSPLTPTNQSIMAGNQLQQSSLQSNYSLLSLIEVCQHPLTKPEYSVHIMKFFKILLSQSWKNPDDISLIRLCSELSSALRENPDRTKLLSEWFERVLMHRTTPTSEELAFGDIQITSRQEQRYYIDDDSNANLYLFFKFITYAIKGTSRFDEVVLSSMADALIENMERLLKVVCIQTDNQFLYFAGLFTTLVHLISAIGQNDVKQPSNQKPLGHFKLIPVVISWLSYCKNYFQKQEKLGGNTIETSLVQGKKRFLLEASFQMLSYLSDIFNAMEYKFVHLRSRSEDVGTKKEEKDPTKSKELIKMPSRIFLDDNYDCEDDCTIHVSDDENDEEDDEELAQLLCTFTQTQKDFINQHWYHCHTCKMLDGKGVCTVCAKVCHRGHDVTYSKYGSFFCDCGANEDNSCKALVKRQVVAKNNGNKTQNKKRTSNQKSNGNSTNNASGKDAKKTIFNKKRSMRISKYWYTAFYAMDQYFSKLADNYKQSKSKFSNQIILQNYEHFGLKYEHLETFAHQLQSYVSPLSENILSLMEFFMPILEKFFRTNSELGYSTRIRKEFQLLQTRRTPLLIEKSEQLMLPVKCWPDTVFENVNISEEQSPSSRHLALVNNAIVLRKLMAVLGANSNLTYGGQTSTVQPCFLVVAHDMNRLSIVQLNHLLGQAYQTAQQQQQSSSSCPPKKKLSPQKIATVSFPFPIMYIAKNPLNEELLAVCGIKECHILSLARNGAITGHRELSLQGLHGFLKPFWFPDSQTELALITAEFIKIYDLGKDGSDQDTPLYNFSIPCRKMRDMTFFSCEENGRTRRFLLIFSCLGPIYVQELCPESRCSTANDVFYVTTILKLSAPEECDLPSLFKGFSIHYSYLLQMLFIAYLDGTSFCCPFNIENIHKQQIDNLTILDQYSNQIPTPANSQGQQYNAADASSSSSATTSSTAAATAAAAAATASTTANANNSKAELPRWCQLFQWTEVPDHPGLVFALTFDTFTPACFMVESGSIKVQELKPKKKVLDFIAVSTAPMSTDTSNNNSGLMQPMEIGSCGNAKNSKVTTLVCLCEDGSLRFYRANNDQTNFWLKPSSFDLDRIPTYSGVMKNCKSRSNASSETLIGRLLEQATETLQFLDDSNLTQTNNRNPKFPVDFFEHCSLMNDIEFGGSDVLEVYNVQQIKNRLNSTNMFIACTKPNGFSITITQTGASDQVMAGVRVNLGVCDPARSPTAIVIFGRTITVPSLNRHRWFDIPFTRQEMKKLLDKNTFTIRFASSSDQTQVTIVDSIRVYGRPRDSLVTQNDDETLTTSTNATSAAAIASNGSGGGSSATGLASGSSSNVDESLEDLRRKLIASMPKKRSTQSPLSLKSQIQKLRLMLYAPSITDDEYVMSLDSRHKTVFVCNRMMANSLDALEALISFTKSLAELSIDHHQPPQATSTPPRWSMLLVISAREMINGNDFKLKCDTAQLIASKMLTVSLSRRLDRSICMLIAKLVPNKFLYDEHRVEIIFENAIESLKQEAYDNVNVFGHNVQLFKETVHEHPKLFIRLIGKYFTQCNDVYTSTIHFCNYLVDLFWRLYSQRPANELLCPLVKVGQYSNFETIVDSLVCILFSSTHAVLLQASHQQDQSVVQSENQKRIIDRASQLVVQMLCSPDLQISFSTKRALLKILYSLSNGVYRHMEKQTKTIQSSSGHQSGHKQNSSSSLSSKVGHRKSSSKSLDSMASSSSGAAVTRSPIYLSTGGSSSSHQPSDSQHQALSNVASEPSTSAGGSGASAAGILRRQGATRRQRSSGANQSWLTRQDSIHQAPPSAQPRQRASGGAGASSGSSGSFQSSANRTAASLLERVTETLIDTDFDPYNSLILNINSDFPYFQDLITNLRREPELDEVYESVPDDDDDDDDDGDDDDEDDEDDDDDDDDDDEDDDDDDEDENDVLDLNLISQPVDQNSLAGSGSSNVPAPLFALNSFPEANDRNLAAIAEPAALEEVINEDVLVEEDDDDEHDEDEDDEFEAMDEDEMMEMAIALSLQEQARGDPRSIEEMIEFVADETDAGRQQQQQQVERAIEEIVEDYRSQRQRDELERIVEQENASQQQQQPEAQRQQLGLGQSSLSSSHDSAGTSASVQPPNISSSHRYSTLHSESDDDDDELFEEDIKLADTTMESIEAEEEHCDDDDYGELDSMETSQTPGHGSKTSKMMSKSNETIASKSNVGSTASSDIITSADYPVPTATFTSGGKNSQSKDAQKNRKRQRKLIASKFCLALLKQMLNSYETLVSGKLTGVQAIPYLQVLSILNDFNYSECDQKEFSTCYNQIMMKMFDHLLMMKQSANSVDGEAKTPSESPINQGSTKYLKKVLYSLYKDRIERRPENEVQLLTMRLFSVWLAYFKRFPTITWQTFLAKDLSISDKLRSLIMQYGDNNKSTGTTKAMVTFDQESMKNVGVETASTMSTGTLYGSSPPPAPVVSTQIPKPSNDSTAVVPPTIHPSLLLFASQMIEMNVQILDYCFTLLYHLLKQHWRQLSIVEPDEYEKNKPGSGKSDQVISYYSKKSINIRSQANYIPVDLRPFFTILPETSLPASFSSVGTNQQQQQQQQQSPPQSTQQTDAAGQANSTGVVVMNNVINTSSNLSHTCTAINSAVFFNNVFDLYPELLTEIALRIPYQLKKLISFLNGQSSLSQQQHGGNKKDADKDDGMFVDVGETATSIKSSSPIHIEFGVHWIETLCEYMTLPGLTPYIRKQVRKLLSNLCGPKERYRQVRDYYDIKTNLRAVREIIVMHFFDSNSTTPSSSSSSFNNLAFKLQDVGLSDEDLGEEEQLDELIRIIIGTVVQNDDKNSTMMMMSSDQHRLLNLPYAQLINLVEYLKNCLDIASIRVQNWQRLCRREVRIVPFLFRISFLFGEGISSIILQLLSLALFSDARQASSSSKKPPQNNLTQNLLMTTGDGGRSKESKPSTSKTAQDKTASIASASNNPQSFICCYVFMVLDQQLMSHFIRFFLLESNSSQQRWATHSLLYMFFESLQPGQQEQFLSLFWQLWPDIACYGKRASQFVDLLGYFTLTISKNNPETNAAATKQERLYTDSAVGLLSYQNQVLIKHPNANIYNSLQSLLELNGYYLETEPCLVCNNPEINFFPMKLSAIKMDSRFTTNTQIVKLIGAHTISKIMVKISELKKTKMVKTLCIYYNNRHVQSVVELKNKNTVWHKAKRMTLAPSQSDVKIEFALPIVACNLMIEYANFYETSHSSTETLQCPRCSSVVLANPGVCTNCGENVFQCHKCRAINYDEKDPYLCNSCGFCKYAKFDYVLTARYTASAVEAIENEEDRTKAVQTINTLLEKADRLYKIILSIRPTLEYLLLASQDYQSTMYNGDGSLDAFNSVTSVASNAVTSGSSSFVTAAALLASGQSATSGTVNSSATGAGATGGSGGGGSSSSATSASPSSLHINRYIQKLASKYSIDCKQHFEDLSKIVQKILYTRKELVDYDNRQTENRHNFEDIKRLLQEYRQDFMKTTYGGDSTTSLSSSTSSSTLVDSGVATTGTSASAIRKHLKQVLVGDEHYHGVETKKMKKLSPEDEDGASATMIGSTMTAKFDFKSGRCYGCASATIEHCIVLLRALVHNPRYKNILGSSNLFRELIDYNLRIGMISFRNKVRQLLCLLIRDDFETTEEFNNLLLEKIGSVLNPRYMTSFDFGFIRHEMSLLASSFENEDNCWEQRLRCVMKLFLLSLQNKSPAVLEAITLPCLRILYGLIIKPTIDQAKAMDHTKSSSATETSTSVGKRQQHQSNNTVEQLASVQTPPLHTLDRSITKIPFESVMVNVSVDLNQWLSGDAKSSFSAWQQRNIKVPPRTAEFTSDPVKLVQLEEYLQRKYFSRWLYLYQNGQIRKLKSECFIVRIASSMWIQEVLFNPTSKALRSACRQLLMALFERLTSKQRVLIDLFTSFLDDLCRVGGEVGLDFYDLYRSIVFCELSPVKTSTLIKNCHWRYYLTFCGLLPHLGHLISAEIERLKQLEESTLSSDFSQGSALRQLVELMQLFMRDERIRRVHKSSMVGFVLDGYLSLRKLIIQRTKMIDETQAALLELLELLTTGTRNETINFMKVCIESVKKCSLQDLRTPVFIFERLCSIIHPEEKDADEFFISLEKDPQQEDFLQGRMLGNPYSSKDSRMGPLMRDIKNKICQECELVSLLEDDSGLELLVNNKIISLDLPVKAVYKKIVCAETSASTSGAGGQASSSAGNVGQAIFASNNAWASGNLNLVQDVAILDAINNTIVFPLGSVLNAQNTNSANLTGSGNSLRLIGPTMKIVYRIRGLMGDATEEFIESLSNKESIVKDDEKLFDLANIMCESNGLSVMLERMQAINEIDNRSRNLLFVLLKLFGFCVRVAANRRALIQPELNAIGVMLRIVHLFLKNPQTELLTATSAPGEPSYFEQLLAIIETILAEASKEEPDVYDSLNRVAFGTAEDVQLLIDAVSTPKSIIFNSGIPSLTNRFLRVVTFLSIGHSEKMTTLVSNFRPYFDFDLYDNDNQNDYQEMYPLPNPDHWYELFCSLVSAIERNHNGARLKNRMIEEGFVMMAIDYLVRNAPPMKNFVLLNSEEWKEFISRPALEYVLKMLTGMSRGHEPTQMLIVEEEGVPIIHALEQVLSDSHMATLAENLMDALKENPSVEAKIEEIRLKTKEEKKRIAMAVREKQLGELGMKANDKGQVMADSELLKKMEGELKEEKGLVCSICREGYAYQPQKVLAIYTFTKRCNVEEWEDRKPRKTMGYTTVTHFNIVHVECHMDAVRHARTRDEWQSASLHNANTRCNGLLPLWGPSVYESLFAHALSRHNSYLQDAVGQRDFLGTNSFLGTVHDLKLLLLRFAQEKSFSEETGGGGAQSNLYLTPYLMHTALYVMNTTKVADKERQNFDENFVQQSIPKFIESCFQVDGAYFYSTMVLLLHPNSFWKMCRFVFLRRLILCSIIRNLPTDSRNVEGICNAQVTYEIIKPSLMFFAMINLFYTIMFKNVAINPDEDWSQILVEYIRHNDQTLLESADKMLETFENDILPCGSFAEFCDACDLMRGEDAIQNPEQFLLDVQNLTQLS